MFDAGLQAAELMTVYLGAALGLYRSLRDGGPATPPELARRAGISERYAQEWLEGQAASGLLTVDDVAAEPVRRRYTISDAHAEVLTDPDSPYSIVPMAATIAGIGNVLPRLVSAFGTGEGLPWADYGAVAIEAQGDFNRPWLKAKLGTEYLPKIPDVHQRLSSRGARVADLACGAGWAAIAIAQAYPDATVEGSDADEYSIELARGNAAAEGVAGRVSFRVADIAAMDRDDRYDVAIVVEAVHDLARPVEFLAAVRRMLVPSGVAIVADERAAETFTAPADELERFLYAVSVLSCLPASLAEQPSAATGAVMRPATLHRYATEAGFGAVSIIDEIEHDFLRFYRLDR